MGELGVKGMSEAPVSVVTSEAIACGALVGPLPLTPGVPDTLSLLTWRCVDGLPPAKQRLKVTLGDEASNRKWLSHVLPARNSSEQTLEVVAKGGQLYFRALRDVSAGEELRAWFGQDLADILRLPVVPTKDLEGEEKRFECVLCREQFENPFPVVAHLMYRCRRKDVASVGPAPAPLRRKNGGRVKNFDIATLTDMNEDNDSCENNRSSPQNLTTSDPAPPPESNLDSGYDSPKKRRKFDPVEDSPPKRSKPVQDSKISDSSAFKVAAGSTVFAGLNADINPSDGTGSSAFTKVDKSGSVNIGSGFYPGSLSHRDMMLHPGVNAYAPFPNYPLPPPVTSSHVVSTHPSMNSSSDVHLSSAFAPKLSSQLRMPDDLKKMPRMAEAGYSELTALMTFNGGSRMAFGAKQSHHQPMVGDGFGARGFPTPLLPFLPPSLAALSFPTQNWCAKCNASFRMTSDLVYHMRSHHKRETDPQKLKREEKLRCHICNETFRERHHLTRHMTSHQ